MNIGIIYQGGEFPPAERIEKEAKSLSRAGHNVFLLCNNYGKFKNHNEKVGDIEVIRIKPTLPSYTLNKILKFPIFLNPIWIIQIILFAKKHRINAFHNIDIPLGLAVIAVGKILKIPVVFDMWEPYPECLEAWGKEKWTSYIFKNHHLAYLVESITLRLVDRIITVVDEKKNALIAKNINKDIITIVTNAVDLETFVPNTTLNVTNHLSPPLILYVGGINRERGLEDIVRACALCKSKNLVFNCIIGGDGVDRTRLISIAEELNILDIISFPGWISFSEVPDYIERSTLCLVPHIRNAMIEQTIPNKLFQYMSLSKPVLVSDAKPLARIIRECNAGYVFQSGNPKSAAQMISEVISNIEEAKEKGQNGRKAIIEKYNWTMESEKLIRIYSTLI